MSRGDVLWAVLVVGVGSLVLRLAPLLVAARLPDRLALVAGWAGVAVLFGFTVRAVLGHTDPGLPAPVAVAVASLSVTLLGALRRWPLIASVGAGAALYLVASVLATGVLDPS